MANSKICLETTEVQHLRSSIHHLVEQQNRTNNKLIGVQVLTDQLEKKNQECERVKTKLKQTEVLLSRAENRIAQISVRGGSTKGGIITPGVNKRVFEAVTRENAKLKIALEHVVNRQQNGIELAVENRDLHDLIVALKAELERNRTETEELRDALKAVESEDTMSLQQQVAKLTAVITQLERSLKGKQVYCESVVRENETLKANLKEVKSEKITQLASLRKIAGDNPAIKEVLELSWTGEDDVDHGVNRDIEKYTKEIESLKKEIEVLNEQRTKSYDEQKKYIEETTKQIQTLTNTNATLRDDIEKMKGEFEEINMMKELLEQQCTGFENDFKVEREEKRKLDADLKKVLKQNQELQQLNRAVKRDNENITRMIKEEFEKKQKQQQTSEVLDSVNCEGVSSKTTSPTAAPAQQWPGTSPAASRYKATTTASPSQQAHQWPGTSAAAGGFQPPHFNPMMMHEQVVSDGAGRHTNKKYSTFLECPVCHCILPPDEMEEHLNDCDRPM